MSYFKIPESAFDDYKGRYIDYDVFAVLNMHQNAAVQAGYRWIDVYYQRVLDSGTLNFQGWYFGFTTRF